MVPIAPSATTGRWRRVVRNLDSTLADMVEKGTGARGALALVIHRRAASTDGAVLGTPAPGRS
jgi:hypothetical protein